MVSGDPWQSVAMVQCLSHQQKTMCTYQRVHLRSAACAIWGTPGQHSRPTAVYTLVYINDLPLLLKAMLPFIFADDTKCLHAAKINTDFTAIQEDLNMACNWSKDCSLSFNYSKSAVIHFWCGDTISCKAATD